MDMAFQTDEPSMEVRCIEGGNGEEPNVKSGTRSEAEGVQRNKQRGWP